MSSLKIANDIILYLDEKIWEGVARVNIKKLAPTSARLEALQALDSHITNQIINRSEHEKFIEDKDPQGIHLDTFTVNGAQIQVNKNASEDKSRRLSVADSTIKSRIYDKKFTQQSFFSKKSISEAKSKILEGPEQQFFKLQEKEDPNQVYDPLENKCRDDKLKFEKEEEKNKIVLKEKNKEREISFQKRKKILKDIKKFTFDYVGDFVGIGSFNPGHERVLKLSERNKGQEIVNKNSKQPENFNVINDKSKERETKSKMKEMEKLNDKNRPLFNENRPESLIDQFQDESKLSEGIKLKGKKGQEQLIKQKPPRKLSGFKKYRLNEYQTLMKDKKFKQFKRKHNSSVQLIDESTINKTTPLPLNPSQPKERHKSKNKSELSLQMDKSLDNGILPPIKAQDKYQGKKSNIKYHRKSNSNRTINVSGLSSRMTIGSKQRIIIDNQEDFKYMLEK